MADLEEERRLNDRKLKEEMDQHEGDALYLKEILEVTREKLRAVEEDRDQAVEFLKEQENEIKEFKERFFHIAEESNNLKNRLTNNAFVMVNMVKVLFNLLGKFDRLAQQKSFLSVYFQQYENVRKKLVEMQLSGARSTVHRETQRVYKLFRKGVFAVIAALRLKRLQVKFGSGGYDSYDVRHGLVSCSEGVKRFVVDLFRSNRFVIQRDLVNAVEDVLRRFEGESEATMVSRIIDAANRYNKVGYEPDLGQKGRRPVKLEDLSSSFRVKDEFNEKLIALDEKLQNAEDYILRQEEKFEGELEGLTVKMHELREERDILKDRKEKMEREYDISKEVVDSLLSLVDENQAILPEMERRKRGLGEDFKILQDFVVRLNRKYEFTRKELEDRDLKVIELERQMIQGGMEENNPGYGNIPLAGGVGSSRAAMKVPGKIVSSGKKRS